MGWFLKLDSINQFQYPKGNRSLFVLKSRDSKRKEKRSLAAEKEEWRVEHVFGSENE